MGSLEADDRGIPTGRTLEVAGGSLDYRKPRPIGTTVIDTCLAGEVVLCSDEASDALTPEKAQDIGRRPPGGFLQDSRHEG